MLEAETYDEAVYLLKSIILSDGYFFTIGGVNPGEGMVITRSA